MISALSNIAFLNPWVLLGLGALPAIWFLLRVMPPPPRLVNFPAVRFLNGLASQQKTPSHTPWWILLLRLLIAALVILALSHPVYNPAEELSGDAPVRLIVDNSWASAHAWDEQMQAAEDILARASRAEREVYVLTTAPKAGEQDVLSEGPLSAAQAVSIIQALETLPWAARYDAMLGAIEKQNEQGVIKSFWFGHGLEEGRADALIKNLQENGGLHYFSPAPERLPLLLRPAKGSGMDMAVNLDAPAAFSNARRITIQAQTGAGQVLDQQEIDLDESSLPMRVSFDMPAALSKDVMQFRIAGQPSAGGTFILDDNFRGRSVGIAGPSDDAEIKPFIEDIYYLKRALEPYSEIQIGNIADILERSPSMIILPDIAAMPAQTLNALEQWVNDGGLLLRFAGPKLAEQNGAGFLTPMPLRAGKRSTQGSMSWDNSPKLTNFEKDSPFYGIDIHDDVTVRQQILPQPIAGISEQESAKIWANLDDGTPLITANARGKGMLVMIHTTASADWSDFALSGSYVEVLKRLLSLSGRSQISDIKIDGSLNPIWVLGGDGQKQKPESWVKPIAAPDFKTTSPGPAHPPGTYGQSGIQKSLNLGSHVGTLKIMDDMPSGAVKKIYGDDYEQALMPKLLLGALILLMFDWLLMIVFMSNFRLFTRAATVFIFVVSAAPMAQANDDIKYASGLYLAYIQTGDSALDNLSRAGLENLSRALEQRTSAQPAGVAGLNAETDQLSFFPLIYWPISNVQKPLSETALKNIQHYLDHGGTILFDTRDQNMNGRSIASGANSGTLRTTIEALNVPPLTPIAKDHVLGRCFYLMDNFPGRYSGGTLWVEQNNLNGRDGVSSIIIGSNDWVSAWAMNGANQSMLSGGSRQQEMAQRFGVNLVMYALTGNYKADQVHVPHILERLGR